MLDNAAMTFSAEVVRKLHTATRRFCIDQRALWVDRYSELQVKEEWKMKDYMRGRDYSVDAYSLFPRYRLAENTLIEVEKLSFDPDVSIADARRLLVESAESAFHSLSKEFIGKDIANVALQLQLRSIVAYILRLDEGDLALVEPLPFRRVLSQVESESLWSTLLSKWSIRGAGYGWYPISDDPRPAGAMTFHKELWDSRNGDNLLAHFLEHQEIDRCFLLRELGPPDYELATTLVKPAYDGSESFLLADGEWVLYVSHESSLTLVGSLAKFVRDQWRDAEKVEYGGPFHTDDLRGSWEGLRR